MRLKPSLKHAVFMSLCVGVASACAAPTGQDIGLDVDALVTPADLHYLPATQQFTRTVIREIQTTNPKQFPFRVKENSDVVVELEWLAPPPNGNWVASRPSTYVVSFSSDGEAWSQATVAGCTQTVSSTSVGPYTCTFHAGLSAHFALIDVSTTTAPGNVNNKRARFGLTYTFTGPADEYESQLPQTVTPNVTGLSVNNAQKASITAGGSLYPGVYEGQGVDLLIERSHPYVVVDPNGPKLKDRLAAHAQYDGTDFECDDWVDVPGVADHATMRCSLEGAATRDSLIHVPFLTTTAPDGGGAWGTGKWGKVTVTRRYVNGYVRE